MKNMLAYYNPRNPEAIRDAAMRKLEEQARQAVAAKKAKREERDRKQGK